MIRKCFTIGFLLIALVSKAEESMEELTRRVFERARTQFELLDSQLGEKEMPKTLTSENGDLVKSDIKWWCSGFFPGSLWLTYEYTGDSTIKALAEKRTKELEPILSMDTDHDIGFIINCSYGNALRLTGDTASYRGTILKAADKLCDRFVPKAGVIRSWDGGWTVEKGWDIPVIIDNMMNLEILLNAYRIGLNDEFRKVAVSHANTTIDHHFRPDYSTCHVVDYSSSDGSVRSRGTHQGYGDETCWARGEAWALYGYTMMYLKTGNEEYFKQANYIAKYILRNLPEDGVPFWDFSRVGEERDASAAAVMASAFIQLYEVTGYRHYLEIADRQLRTLSGNEYLSNPGEAHGFLLKHSVGSKPSGSEVDVPLTYADYYFLEALMRRQRASAHPRLFLDAKGWDNLRSELEDRNNTALNLMHKGIMDEAGKLPQDKVVYRLDESGKRILTEAQKGFKRVAFDAYAYRFTSDKKYLDHAQKTLREICDMPDWNGDHFLDVAEMATALAIGYDWLYDVLDPELKRRMVEAIDEKAFTEAFDFNKAWFYDRSHNWNQVCNGGLAMAALAFREDCGAVAGNIIRNAVRTNGKVLDKIYGPDGCYPEGPNYWGYGNAFQMMLNGSFDSALGDDFGLSCAKGFDRTGDFVVNCYGTDGKMFNYYDNALKASPSLPLWYFAWRFDKPYLVSKELEFIRDGHPLYNGMSEYLPVAISYASRMDLSNITEMEPKMYVGHGNNPIATVRGSGQEWFLGVKGGMAANNHGHADAGSFVFVSDGVRWAADPGSINYTTVENELRSKGGNFWSRSQNSLRWTIYPIANEWHNTLTVNGKKHVVNALARIVSTVDEPEYKKVCLDFGKVLGEDVNTAHRTFEIGADGLLTVTDFVKAENDSRVCFTLVSEASPSIEGDGLVLHSGENTMYVRTSGAKASFKAVDCPAANENGLSVIRIEYIVKAGHTVRFKTVFTVQ